MLVKHFAQVLSSTRRQNIKQGIWKKIPHYKLKLLNIFFLLFVLKQKNFLYTLYTYLNTGAKQAWSFHLWSNCLVIILLAWQNLFIFFAWKHLLWSVLSWEPDGIDCGIPATSYIYKYTPCKHSVFANVH